MSYLALSVSRRQPRLKHIDDNRINAEGFGFLPAKYGDAAKSPLKFEVKAGQKKLFDLQLAD